MWSQVVKVVYEVIIEIISFFMNYLFEFFILYSIVEEPEHTFSPPFGIDINNKGTWSEVLGDK